MRKPLFMLGWGFLAAAFAAAALESVAPAFGARAWLVISAKDLWHTIYPLSYVLFKGFIEDISPFLWNPVMEVVLWPPAWALLSLPGVLLTWHFRPNKILRPDQELEIQRQRESLFLFDELSSAAALDDTLSDGDDRAPRHFVVEELYDKNELESWDNTEGAQPDTHDIFEDLEEAAELEAIEAFETSAVPGAPGVIDLKNGNENTPVIKPVFEISPPPDAEGAADTKPEKPEDKNKA